MGAGQKPQPHRASGQNMVPEPADEEQEEFAAAGERKESFIEQFFCGNDLCIDEILSMSLLGVLFT